MKYSEDPYYKLAKSIIEGDGRGNEEPTEPIQCFDLKCETKTPHTHWSVWTATTNETILEGLEKFRLERRLAVIKFALYVALVVIIPIIIFVLVKTIKHW